MIISVTAVSRNQWNKIGVVALWVVLTNGVGVLVAYLTKQPGLLALGPTLNVLGKTLQSVFESEEQQSIASLPADARAEAQAAALDVAAGVGRVFTPTVPKSPVPVPTIAPSATPPTTIGSTVN